jgi:hypothetical protein
LILGFGREPPQDELLSYVGQRALAGGDNEIPQEQAWPAIRLGIIGIRQGRRGQIATYGRIVRLQLSGSAPSTAGVIGLNQGLCLAPVTLNSLEGR